MRDSTWKSGQLRYLGKVIPGNSPPSETYNSENEGLPFIQGSGEFNHENPDPNEYCTAPSKTAEPGDILISIRAPVGELNIAKEKLGIGRGVAAFRPDNDILLNRYVWYAIQSSVGRLIEQSKGSTFSAISADELGSLEIPVPPLNNQREICDFLNSFTGLIDSTVFKNKGLIQLLDEKYDATIEMLCLRGISNQRYTQSDRLDVIDSCPKDWKIYRAKTLFREKDDRGYADLPLLEVSLNHGVRLREDNEDRNAWEASDLKDMKRVGKGDLVFNKMRLWQGAVGRSRYEGLVSPDYTVLEPRQNLNTTYYEYLLRTEAYKTEVNRRSYGVVDDRKRIYWKQFGDLPLLHPTPSEQDEIVGQIRSSHGQIDELRSKVQKSIRLLQEKRQALITKAVTGQIDLSNWQLQNIPEVAP